MLQSKKIPVSLIVMLSLIFCLAIQASAVGGFSVSPVLPDNQKEDVGGYYNLTVEPGQTQELVIMVDNDSEKEIGVTVEAITATTSDAGLVNYSTQGPVDETLNPAFADMATIPESHILIPAGTTKEVTVQVTMPDTPFDGYVLGSIAITKDLDEAGSADTMFVNQYSYVIAVMLNEGRVEGIAPELVMGDVTTELVNGRITVVSNVHNPKPLLMTEMEATAQVFKAGQETPVMEMVLNDVEMAPNSVFPMSLTDNNGQGLEGGDYISKVALRYQDQDWAFEQEFHVEATVAEELNKNAVNLSDHAIAAGAGGMSGTPVWVMVLIGVGAAVILAGLLILVKVLAGNRRRNKALEREMMEKLWQQQQAMK